VWRSIHSGRAAACLGIARGAVAFAGHAGATPQVEVFDMRSDAIQRAPGPLRTANGHDLPSAVRRASGTDGRAGDGARVVVGNDLACHWLLAPPTGATSLREIQAVAQARFADLFAERPDEWLVTGDWRTGHPFICTAVPKWVVAGVHAATPDAMPAAYIGTVLGLALERFHRQLPNTGWCCVHSPRSLALMHLRAGLPVTLRVAPVVESATRDGIFAAGAEALQREAACQALSPVIKATWLDLTALRPRDASTPRSDHSGIAFRVLRLDHGHRTSNDATGAAGEATVAALLGAGSGVSVS
jgi:hypothetical protein